MGIIDSIMKLFTPSRSLKSDLLPSEKKLLSEIAHINASYGEITAELYQQLRDYEMNWLERHYDFSTLDGINSIPVSTETPGAPSPGNSSISSHTGEVYYYLRHKAYCYEESGDNDLALACMRKSVALVKCRSYFSTDDCFPLVRMLARAGLLDEASKEVSSLERIFGKLEDASAIIDRENRRGCELRDYRWILEHFPEKCPKTISSYRRMKKQNTKNFQLLKTMAADLGREI